MTIFFISVFSSGFLLIRPEGGRQGRDLAGVTKCSFFVYITA